MNGELVESGSRCGTGHPIWLVAEGYGLCCDEGFDWWYAWSFSPRHADVFWMQSTITGRDGEPLEAWVQALGCRAQADALTFIQGDMDAHRAQPFDEEVERARLVAVPR